MLSIQNFIHIKVYQNRKGSLKLHHKQTKIWKIFQGMSVQFCLQKRIKQIILTQYPELKKKALVKLKQKKKKGQGWFASMNIKRNAMELNCKKYDNSRLMMNEVQIPA